HQHQLYLTETSTTCDDYIPYAELVGSLNYIVTRTRPEIAYIVNSLFRFISKPKHEHWEAAKRVLRYLQGTMSMGICFRNDSNLAGFADNNFAGDPEQRRSTSGFIFTMSGGLHLTINTRGRAPSIVNG